MNKATFDVKENKATFNNYKNTVNVESIRIESHFFYMVPTQVVDTPKERDA